jgi:outer membrane biosynthesis protein TonB
LYNEFPSVPKYAIEARYKESFGFTETYNSIKLIPHVVVGKSTREKSFFKPTHPKLLAELRDLRAGNREPPRDTGESSGKETPREPPKTETHREPPKTKTHREPPKTETHREPPKTETHREPPRDTGESSRRTEPPKETPDYAPPPRSERIPVSLNEFRNAFQVLGIPSTNDKSKIKERFKFLARQSHPDKARSNNSESFQTIKTAYDTINKYLDSLPK